MKINWPELFPIILHILDEIGHVQGGVAIDHSTYLKSISNGFSKIGRNCAKESNWHQTNPLAYFFVFCVLTTFARTSVEPHTPQTEEPEFSVTCGTLISHWLPIAFLYMRFLTHWAQTKAERH